METAQEPRVEEVLGEIHGLESRDFRLWTMSLAIILGLTAGLLAFILPSALWNLSTLHLAGQYSPQFFFGLSLLIVLYNIYTFDLRRRLNHARQEFVRQLLRAETAETLSLLDPLTEAFNRRYLERIIPKETARADRLGSSLTILMVDLDEFRSVNTRFGHLVGDLVLKELVGLLKKLHRRSDVVIRYGGDEFMVVMPDCAEEQGPLVVDRLLKEVEQWNGANRIPGYRMSVSCGLAGYAKGMNILELVEEADQRMYQHKARRNPSA